MEIGNGIRILFWDDWSFGSGLLKDDPWALPWMDLCVWNFGRFFADYISDGIWKRLYDISPSLEILSKALSFVHIPCFSPLDKVVWMFSSNGKFSLFSLYPTSFLHCPTPF